MSETTILDGVEGCGLHNRTPYGIKCASKTQLSVARYSGGCKYNGDEYVYNPQTDELIRADVLKWKRKKDRAEAKKATK